MAHSDFIRRLPGHEAPLRAKSSIARRLHIDLPLLGLLLVASVFGLIVLFSASGENLQAVVRQGIYFCIAFGAMFVLAQFDPQTYRRWAPVAYLVGLGLLGAVLVFGSGAKGAQRWLNLPGLPRFQPSEIMKLVVPMTVAWYLAPRVLPPRLKDIAVAVVLLGLPAVLIVEQPDLGTAILIGAAGMFVLFLAGASWRYAVAALLLCVASAIPAWKYLLHEYQRQRILTLLDPELDKLGAGWNIIQSKTAIGSGGLQGKGWLEGTQSHLDFLPESHTDFIIAVLGEEFGLIGVSFLLLLYLLIVGRGLVISMRAQHTFGRLMAGSITLTFFVYVFVNMGMVAGLLPVVGVPLPLVSQGGTSLVTLLAGFGILMAISTEERLIMRR